MDTLMEPTTKKFYVDADACPVKSEIEKVANRHKVETYIVSNGGIRPSENPLLKSIIVDEKADAADIWIADHTSPNDIVITSDIVLASKVIETGAEVIKPNGDLLNSKNIGEILATRDLMYDLRSADPFRQGGSPTFGKKDRSRFLDVLDRMVRK